MSEDPVNRRLAIGCPLAVLGWGGIILAAFVLEADQLPDWFIFAAWISALVGSTMVWPVLFGSELTSKFGRPYRCGKCGKDLSGQEYRDWMRYGEATCPHCGARLSFSGDPGTSHIPSGGMSSGTGPEQRNKATSPPQSGPPKLGIDYADASQIALKKGMNFPAGAYVGNVETGSPAEKAGLQKDDIIIELAGQRLNTGADLDKILLDVHARRMKAFIFVNEIRVTVWRNGREIHLKVPV